MTGWTPVGGSIAGSFSRSSIVGVCVESTALVVREAMVAILGILSSSDLPKVNALMKETRQAIERQEPKKGQEVEREYRYYCSRCKLGRHALCGFGGSSIFVAVGRRACEMLSAPGNL